MAKLLMINPNKCTGCRNCELACSFQHEKSFRPGASRIHVFLWERDGFSTPLMCQQCEDAACVNVCPTGAMHRNPTNPSLVECDQTICIGCKMCVIACPFGCVRFDTVTRAIAKCDTCGGDPMCVQMCPNGALEFVDDAEQVRSRKLAMADKFKAIFEEVS
jgi:Fe-S-cluster-containing hydrogenase component 2